MLATATVIFGSCKKDDKNSGGGGGGSTSPKAAKGTFVIDGTVYVPATFQGKVDGDDYIVQGLGASGSLGFMQVRFADKPAAGTYDVEACQPQTGYFNPTNAGKASLYTWGTDAGSMSWSNAASTGKVTVTVAGDSATVVVNDVVLKRGTEDKFHTVSINFTAALQ